MLKWLCNNGMFEDALLFYEKCRISGCPSDNYTFPLVIKACAALHDFLLVRIVHCVVLRNGCGENLVVKTALLGFYAKMGRIGIARFMLDGMPEPDLVAWNALISGCSMSGFDGEVLQLFKEACDVGLKPNVSTFASVIPVCSRLGFLDVGKSFHGFVIKSGYHLDESLIPCLISMYASCGDLLLARNIFDCLKDKNIVAIWNAIMSAYTRNQKSSPVFELFHEMLQVGLKPDVVTFVVILPSCETFGSFWHGESLHACAIKLGLANQHSVATALLSMYAKFGDIKSAESLFDCMIKRNLLSWNSMVSAYISNGLLDASLAAFREMQLAGVNPDSVSVISVLSTCSELEAFLMGKSIHSFSVKKRIDFNLNVSNALLAFYSGFGKLFSAFNIFNRMDIRNVVSWNTMISGCIYNGQAETALLLLHQMQKEDVGFDLVTLKTLLPSCNVSEDLMLGVTIHGYAIKTGLECDVSLANALLSMYVNNGDLESGLFLFEDMPSRDVVSWNALLTGYRYHNLACDITVLTRQMIEEKQKPNYITLLSLLPSCNAHFQGKAIHAYAIRTGIVQETPFLTSLILMYAGFGNAKSCLFLFQMGQDRTLSLWNAVISAHLKLNDATTAFSFFIQLLRREMEPDKVTILSIISACVRINNLIINDSLFSYLIRKGFDNDVTINNALIDLFVRCGNISVARKLFELLPQKDSVSWSVMINGYGLHGDGEAALSLFSHMRLSGTKPDDITYLNLLSACNHAGLVEQGRAVIQCMIHDGVLPRMEHYACFVDLLGRTGYLNEAYDIIKSLPYKLSRNLLDSFLGACLLHGNVELGEKLGMLLVEMQSGDSGPHVILHNIYAAAGRWTDANRVRCDMEEKQLKKVPGFSLVEGSG
ncbi:hypothetical protein ACH5RR_014065 [Cinchona calisaya]|uniref:Pentatricopeptide repeat-containing protein n=1 Tax=Cinchona calisaya TaxID=153742 RepID=A0ABD3A7M5_9GENT